MLKTKFRIFYHGVGVLGVYLVLLYFLHTDYPCPLVASKDRLERLNIDEETYLCRAEHFIKYAETEPSRVGPGEQGHAVHVEQSEEEINREVSVIGYNRKVCEQIALDRASGVQQVKE